MRILVVEDETSMAALLKDGLEEEGHIVSVAHNGQLGYEFADASEFDAIVLDVMLPRMDGYEVTARLRSNGNYTPIIMLTARDAVQDIARGLDQGVDDYLTKPFSFVELLARLRSIVRRGHVPRPVALRMDDLVLDPAAKTVFRGDREIHLTATEFRLLEFLMRRAGRVAARETILDAVWGVLDDVEENTLDVFISLLRGKIDRGAHHKLIHTVRGVGYTMRPPLNDA